MALNNHTQGTADEDPSKAKHGWPRTPDGTIDWETVFEAPESGLLALVSAANTHDTLYKVTEKIIRQLFTRRGDENEVEAFLGELTRITTSAQETNASVDGTRRSIIDLLRRIKTGRIVKAAEYVAEQKAKTATKKSRRVHRRDDDRKLALKKRVMLMACGGLAAAALLIGVMAFLLGSAPDQSPVARQGEGETPATTAGDTAAADEQVGYIVEDPEIDGGSGSTGSAGLSGPTGSAPDEPSEGQLEFTALGYPVGTIEAENIPELAKHAVTLEPILFGRNVGGGRSSKKFILPVLSIRNPDAWEEVCQWGPVLTEAITGVMNRRIPQTGDLTNEHMAYAGEIATQVINQKLGGSVVDKVYLLYDVNRRMTDSRARCELVETE